MNAAADRLHQLVLSELRDRGHQRLGDANASAHGKYIDSGALPELVRIYHLLGDPALRLGQ